jgi:hypothetical protein
MAQLAEVTPAKSPALPALEVGALPAVRTWLAVLAAAGILASAALYNGYALTFWDTRAYLEAATTLMPRADRLIGYSFLLRAASWTGSLWPMVFAQSALVAWLLWRVLSRVRPELGVASYLMRATLLSGCTALPWISGQLMADIFTPVLVLALWLYLEDETLSLAPRLALLSLIALCVTVHLTHLPLGLALIGLTWLCTRGSAGLRRRLAASTLALLLGLIAIGGWNASRVGRFTLASGSDTFLLGHLVDTGIASRILDAHCGERDYWLCPHRGRLPIGTDELLWVDALDLHPWENPALVSQEVSRLMRDSLRELPLLHARVALASTLQVLGRFATGEGLDADARSLIEAQLQPLAPADVTAFATSRQQRDAIAVTAIRRLHTPIGWLFICVTPLMFARALRRKEPATPRLRLLAFVTAAWLLNAVLSANLSGIYDRYESRLVWLFGLALSAWLELDEHRQSRSRAGADATSLHR